MPHFVIAMDRNIIIGMLDEGETVTLFWNSDDGFGDLASATVFTEEEAQNYDLPIANNQPDWIQLPEY